MAADVVNTATRTRNQSELDRYARHSPMFMAGHPATSLARFGGCEVRHGAAVGLAVIIEFPTFELAKAWDESPAYQEACEPRVTGGDYRVIIVEGLAPTPAH